MNQKQLVTSRLLPPARNEGAKRLRSRVDQLAQLVPPGTVNPEQFAVAAIIEANRLNDVDHNSLSIAALNCAVVGLIPGPLGHAHFIPFKDRKTGRLLCQLVVGYRGFLELGYGSGFLADVTCEVVLKGEEYEHYNDETGVRMRHPVPLERELTWNNVRAAYCIWHGTAGGRGFEVVGRDELEKLHRKGNVWNTAPIAMCKKTPIRRAASRWKQTQRLAEAAYLDELAERGEAQPNLRPEPEPEAPPATLADYEQTDVDRPPADRKVAAKPARAYREMLVACRSVTEVAKAWDQIDADGDLSQDDKDSLAACREDLRRQLDGQLPLRAGPTVR